MSGPSWRRRGIAAVAAALVLGMPAAAPAAPSSLPPLEHLAPGQVLDAHQRVPVTVVFVGLEPGQGPTRIDRDRLLASQLRSTPLVDRTTRFYEQAGYLDGLLEPARTGLTYDYDYRTVFAGEDFEDAFFEHLTSIGLGPVPHGTVFQQAYSAHPLAAQQIPSSLVIDATAAERWLADNAGPRLAVDTTRPTVFFINWFGRPDFQFHTYAFLDARPGWPFAGGNTHTGQMIAFGGSAPDTPYGDLGRLSRLWFYDLSAGPEWNTANWELATPDFNGDGVDEERFPPIWEYGTTHWYRPFDDLTADLAKLLRFVAVDQLFGQAPVYDPAISEPLLADGIEVDLNVFSGKAAHEPPATLRPGEVRDALARLDPTRSFTIEVNVAPLAGRVSEVFDCQQSAFTRAPSSCFGNRSRLGSLNAFYDLDRHFDGHRNQYLEGVRYEAPVAVFDVPDQRVRPGSIGGLASSHAPNIQSWSYAWLAPRFRNQFLLDETGTVTHEVGHHLGLSHVHDGFDAGLDRDLTADGAFLFLLAGGESNTGMSYMHNTSEFGQFDRDNMARWQLAARLDNANRILGEIARSPRASQVSAQIAAADARAGAALAALNAWDLPAASHSAADAYRRVVAAAGDIDVQIEPWSAVADQANGAGVIAAATDPRDLGQPVPPQWSPGLLLDP